MKRLPKLMALLIVLVGALLVVAQENRPAPMQASPDAPATSQPATSQPTPPELTTDLQHKSYLMGLQFVKQIRDRRIPVDPDALLWGVISGLTGQRLLTEAELVNARKMLGADMKALRAQQQAELRQLAENNLAAGEDFMAENKEEKGVAALASGLQYKVIKKGTGAFPKAEDTVKIYVRGWFIDGKQFATRGERPARIKLDAPTTIKGWREGLQRMQVGGIHRLYVPPALGLGMDTRTGIPPNSTLIFEIELAEIVAAEPAASIPRKP